MTKFKGITLIAIFLLLGVGISAGWEFDNVKEFTPDDKYGKIEIVNALGLGSTLAEHTLLKNTEICAVNCYAEGVTTLYSDGVLFSDLNFKDLQQKLEREVLNSQIYLIKTRTVSYSVPEYSTNCNKEEVNGSFTGCETVQNGSHLESYNEEYKEEYKGEELKAGVYEWRVEGQKNIHSSVDWIATSMGIDLTEWAAWKAGGIGRILFNVTNNVGSAVNISYENTFDTSGFTNPYLVFTNEAGTVEYGFVNTTDIISATTNLFIDLPELATGLTNFYLYEMSTPQTTYNFEDFTSKIKADTGEGRANGADVSTNPDWSYISGVMHYNTSLSYFTDTAFSVDTSTTARYSVAPVGNTRNTTLTFWGYLDSALWPVGAEYWTSPRGTENGKCGWIKGGSATHIWCDGGWDVGDAGGNVLIGGDGWHRWDYVVYGSSNITLYYDGQFLASENDPVYTGIWFDCEPSAVGCRWDDMILSKSYPASEVVISAGSYEIEVITNFIAQTNFTNTTAYYDTELNCSTNYTGANGGYVNFTYFKNDVVVTTYDTQINSVNNGTTVYTDTIVTETLVKGNEWICSVNSFDGTNFQTENSTTLTVSNSLPTIPTLQSPLNISNSTTLPTTFKCNGSTDGDVSDTVYYEFWGNYSTTDLVLRQNLTATTWNFTFDYNGTFYWKCLAHDNASSTNFTDTWQVFLTTGKITSEEESHTDPTIAGNTDLYQFNLSFEPVNVESVTAQFFINGTSQTVNRYNFTNNKTLFNATKVTPNYNSGVTLNLTWLINVNLVNGTTELRNYNYTQVVNQLSITSCSAGNSSEVMNFTLRDEINKTLQNGTFEAHFIVWGNNAAINSSLSVSTLSGSSFYLCLNPTNLTRTVNSQIDYNGIGYDRRDYFFRSVTLNSSTSSNTTLETNLYLLTDSEAVATKFVVTNELEEPLTDHYIYAQRKDISNATFFTVAMGKTDSVGEGYIPLDFYDAWYKFVVYDSDNNLVKITDETILQSTPVLIKIKPSPISDVLTSYDNIDLALSFDNDTKIFTLTYSDPTSTGVTMCMDVNKLSYRAANQTVCSQCVTSVSGSISCGVGTEEGRYVAIVYAEHSPLKNLLVAYYEYVTEIGDKLGVDGVVYILLILLTVVFLFLTSPTLAIFAAVVGVVFVSMLGFASLPYLAVISIVCAGVILLTVIRS